MRGRVSYSLYYSVKAVWGVHDLYKYIHILWASQFVHATQHLWCNFSTCTNTLHTKPEVLSSMNMNENI